MRDERIFVDSRVPQEFGEVFVAELLRASQEPTSENHQEANDKNQCRYSTCPDDISDRGHTAEQECS